MFEYSFKCDLSAPILIQVTSIWFLFYPKPNTHKNKIMNYETILRFR